ncbi:MAG: polyphosphate polymerase domain-containing protein [Pseudobutyrivibrio sp.]|nr:polyphosphate polymerase domain-containing protein [Pseudobutyrivibrio sp.]
MSKIQKVFNRYEKKYLLTKEQYENLKDSLDSYMCEDEYGVHTIRNIYFDTNTDELIRTSIEGPKYKEKFRIRCYGNPTEDSTCFLEIKKKYKGLVNKRRITLSMKEARDYINNGIKPDNQGQIFSEIDFFLGRYDIYPKRYIAYDRLAMYGREDNEFRVTFDTAIRSRVHNLTLLDDTETTLLIPREMKLMEVKISEAMPIWFARLLSENEIYPTSFSKYGNFYKKQILEEKISC